MKILFIGFGSIAKKHYTALRKLFPYATVFALRSGVAKEVYAGVVDVFSWDEVPSDLTFCIISNPTFLHTGMLKEAVSRRIPVFMEKPVSHELDGLQELAEEIEQLNLPTYVACNLRFLTMLRFLKQQVSGLLVNEVNVYCGSYLPDWRPGTDYRQVYSAHTDMGGGVHLDLFHELDYVCWLFGFPQQYTALLQRKSSLGIDAVDYAHYMLEYELFTAQVTLNYFRRTPKRSIEIVTDTNIWNANLLTNSITDAVGNLVFEDDGFRIIDTYESQLKYFVEQLQGGGEMMNSIPSSLGILKICLSNG